jgi:hypothetical protein
MVGGDDFGGTDDAAGVEAYFGYRIGNPLDVNVGVHYSSHRVSTSFDLSLLGLYLEPRLLFERRGAPVAGFLGMRGAWVRRGVSDLSSSGFAVGGIVGLQVGTSWPVRIEPAITATFLSFAPFSGSGERDTGSAIGLQLGISVPFVTSGS